MIAKMYNSSKEGRAVKSIH